MPLPERNTTWPPETLAPIAEAMREWSAWYEGTPDALATVYSGQHSSTVIDRHTARVGGILGAFQRMWWGRTPSGPSERVDQAHIPIAADLARASADLLYAEAPALTVEEGNDATQERLDGYLDSLHPVLATGAEIGAALGGRYHRVTWDPATKSDGAFVTTVDADAAWPEFRWGKLVAVTFWHVLSTDRSDSTVIRHLERHELDGAGSGLIFHGLYEGTGDSLGQQKPLAENPTTAPLAAQMARDGAIASGRTPGLCVVYVPNQTPQRRWRQHPIGRHLGRSDFDGIEPLMDNLDETFSSLLRDIRIGKGRVIVPEFMLDSNGPGRGATFDADRSVYDGLNIPAPEYGTPNIVVQQFAIRVAEHLDTCREITRQIIHTAGYSTDTFGGSVDGTAAVTATEVHARERATFRTRDRKLRNETPALQSLLTKMLTIDAAVFNVPGLNPSLTIAVEFSDSAEDSPLTIAQTVQALSVAKAASIDTMIRMQHPEWTGAQVTEEREQIIADQGTVADPFAIGR